MHGGGGAGRVSTHPTQLTCCAYPPRSRRGTHRGKRLGREGRTHINAAYFQHRPPYSNTARRRPDVRRGENRRCWTSLRQVWYGAVHTFIVVFWWEN